MKTAGTPRVVALLASVALLACGGESSSKLDGAVGGAGGAATGSGGSRTGGSRTGGSGGARATGGFFGTGGGATGGVSGRGGGGGATVAAGGTTTAGTGGGPRDGGYDAGTGGAVIDGGLHDGALDGGAHPDGLAEHPDGRLDVPLDLPGDQASPDGATPDVDAAKDGPTPDAADTADASPCGVCPGGLVCGGGGTPDRCGTVFPLVPDEFCSPDGWCFESPRPHGNELRAVYATTANDIWAVGSGGTIMHFDGTAWAGVTGLFDASGTQLSSSGAKLGQYNLVNFLSVWASGPDDIWIAGSTGSGGTQTGSTEVGLLVRGDGTRWEIVPVPEATARFFTGVWGSGPSDVWVVGYSSSVAHHFDGNAWTASKLPTDARYARGVAGASPTEIYLATTNGVFQGNGTSWSQTTVTATMEGAWVSPTAGKWAWGSSIWHLIGTTWVNMGSGVGGSLWGRSETSLWKGDSYFDGTTWATLPGASNILAVHGPKGDGAVGVGMGGAVFDLSTTAATPAFANDAALAGKFYDVQARAANDVWLVGYGPGPTGQGMVGRAVHWDGQAYTAFDEPAVGSFTAVGVGADGTVLLGSAEGPYRLSEGTFTATPGATNSFQELWVAAGDAAWGLTGGSALIYFYDGATWQTVPHVLSASTVQLEDVWGLGRDDVWVVGTTGMTLHWNGTAWTAYAAPSATAKLVGVWGTDTTHVWAIAEDGALFAWNGTEWQSAPAFTGKVSGLHGCSATELWAAVASQSGPNLGRFDGVAWTASVPGVTSASGSTRLWCAAPGDAWFVTGGKLLRRVTTP